MNNPFIIFCFAFGLLGILALIVELKGQYSKGFTDKALFFALTSTISFALAITLLVVKINEEQEARSYQIVETMLKKSIGEYCSNNPNELACSKNIEELLFSDGGHILSNGHYLLSDNYVLRAFNTVVAYLPEDCFKKGREGYCITKAKAKEYITIANEVLLNERNEYFDKKFESYLKYNGINEELNRAALDAVKKSMSY